ncbi:MAG: STAS domain-containing protein [Albidovulum sp.]|uniref:STAS domain-containing protein n=1 Tax=Albidovulum sp. TaxID=1872424 RepID=UPI003C8B6A00
MNLVSESIDDALVVRVQDDRIDASVAIQFKDQMRELTTDHSGRVVLDLGQVNFVDSSGLGAIVSVMKFLAPTRKLELAALTANVDKVFHLTRMDSVFAIHASAPAANQDERHAH